MTFRLGTLVSSVYKVITSLYTFGRLLKRVDQSENSVGDICEKINTILTKLESMDKAKIKRRETMSRLIDSIIDYMDKPLEGKTWKSEASFGNREASAVSKGRESAIPKGSSISIKVNNTLFL